MIYQLALIFDKKFIGDIDSTQLLLLPDMERGITGFS